MHILHIFVDSYRFKQLQVFFSSFFIFIFYNLLVTMRKGFKLLETYGDVLVKEKPVGTLSIGAY